MSTGSPQTCAPSSTRARDCWSRSSRRHQPDHTRRYSAVSIVIMGLALDRSVRGGTHGSAQPLRTLAPCAPFPAARRLTPRAAPALIGDADSRQIGRERRLETGLGYPASENGGRSRLPLLQPGSGLWGRRRTPPVDGGSRRRCATKQHHQRRAIGAARLREPLSVRPPTRGNRSLQAFPLPFPPSRSGRADQGREVKVVISGCLALQPPF